MNVKCEMRNVKFLLRFHFVLWVLLSPFLQDLGTVFRSLLSCVGIELFSRTVSRKVSSPLQSLTSVFGMGTGGPSAFVTPTSAVRQRFAIH